MTTYRQIPNSPHLDAALQLLAEHKPELYREMDYRIRLFKAGLMDLAGAFCMSSFDRLRRRNDLLLEASDLLVGRGLRSVSSRAKAIRAAVARPREVDGRLREIVAELSELGDLPADRQLREILKPWQS